MYVYMGMGTHVCIWGPKADVRDLPQSLSTLMRQGWSVTLNMDHLGSQFILGFPVSASSVLGLQQTAKLTQHFCGFRRSKFFFLNIFYYIFSSITFPMLSQKSPIPSLPYPPIPIFLALVFPLSTSINLSKTHPQFMSLEYQR